MSFVRLANACWWLCTLVFVEHLHVFMYACKTPLLRVFPCWRQEKKGVKKKKHSPWATLLTYEAIIANTRSPAAVCFAVLLTACSQLVKGKVGRSLGRSAALIVAGHWLNVPPLFPDVPRGDILMMGEKERGDEGMAKEIDEAVMRLNWGRGRKQGGRLITEAASTRRQHMRANAGPWWVNHERHDNDSPT